jgi:cytochrome P450
MRTALAALFRLVFSRRVQRFRGIPGPAPLFPLGNAWDFLGRPPWKFKPPWLTCAEYGSRYGGLTLIWIAGRPYVVLNDGALVREVLETNARQYYKADPIPALSPLTIPPDLFLVNDGEWQRLRTQHPYAKVDPRAWLADQLPILRGLVRERARTLAKASATRPIDLLPALQRLTFDVFARSLWGEVLDDQTYRDFCTMGDVGSRRMTSPLAFLPPLRPRFYAARRRWTRTFAARLDEARRRPDPTQRDLLHVSLPHSQALSDDTYRVLLATMFYGGVYSVTSGIVTVLDQLSRYPDIAAEVRNELHSLVSRDPDFDLTALEGCRHLDAVIRESLRLLPPVPMFLRNVRREQAASLGGYSLPPNTPILITTWALHRSAEHWEAADEFRPARWERGAAEANPFGSDYFFPFGRGPRTCIGQSMALFSMKLMLAALLSEVTVQVSGDYRQSFYFGVMLPRGLRAVMRPLETA